MGRQAIANAALTAFVRRLQPRFVIQRVVLFGSRARGDALRDSDTDVLIVSPSFAGLDFTSRVATVLDLWRVAGDLEPICLTSAEFAHKRRAIGIVRTALREGIALQNASR